MLSVTTAINQRYRLSAFPSYIKNDVKELHKLKIKLNTCCEDNQSCAFPILPSENPKPQPFTNFDPKKICAYVCLNETETNTTTQENEQHDFIHQVIKGEVKGFSSTENLSAETEEAKV